MMVRPLCKVGLHPLISSADARLIGVGTAKIIEESGTDGSLDRSFVAVVLTHNQALKKVVPGHDPIEPAAKLS